MAGDSKWYFTAEQLRESPSKKCGMDADQELMYRQKAANLIQDMGQRLHVYVFPSHKFNNKTLQSIIWRNSRAFNRI